MVVSLLNKLFNYLIAAGLVLYGLYFFLGKETFQRQKDVVQKSDFSSVDHEKIVNKYLQETSKKMLQDQYNSKRAVEKAFQQPLKLNKQIEVSPADIPREQQIHKDQSSESSISSNSKINQEIQKEPFDKIDKKEYARQFIENARRGGYHIELSDDLEVIGVTPLRTPSQQIDSFEILPSN